MNRIFTLLRTLTFCLAFTACQKGIEPFDGATLPNTIPGGNPNSSTDIKGTWKLLAMDIKSTSTVQTIVGSDTLKTVTESDYSTENTVGTIVIDAVNMVSKDVSYSVNTVSKSTIYENGVLTDTLSFPFQAIVPTSSGTTPYKLVGSDSLTFLAGSSFMGGATQSTQPGGAKFTLQQNKLVFMQHAVQTITNTTQGQTATNTGVVFAKSTFERQ